MKMVEHGWKRLKSVENDWNPLKTVENSWNILKNIWKLLKMVDIRYKGWNLLKNCWEGLNTVKISWKQLKTVGKGWKRLNTVEYGWKQLKMVENGWKLLKTVENCWKLLKAFESIWKPLKFGLPLLVSFSIFTKDLTASFSCNRLYEVCKSNTSPLFSIIGEADTQRCTAECSITPCYSGLCCLIHWITQHKGLGGGGHSEGAGYHNFLHFLSKKKMCKDCRSCWALGKNRCKPYLYIIFSTFF